MKLMNCPGEAELKGNRQWAVNNGCGDNNIDFDDRLDAFKRNFKHILNCSISIRFSRQICRRLLRKTSVNRRMLWHCRAFLKSGS